MESFDGVDGLQQMAGGFDRGKLVWILPRRSLRPKEFRLPQFTRQPSNISEVGFKKIGIGDRGLKVGFGELATVATELGPGEISIDEVCAGQVGVTEVRADEDGLTQ